MKKALLLFHMIVLMSLTTLAQTDSLHWKNPLYGSVKQVYEKKYEPRSSRYGIDKLTEKDFLAIEKELVLKDSTVRDYNDNEMVIRQMLYCPDYMNDIKNIVPCFETNLTYDDNSIWLNSYVINYQKDDTTYYKVITATKEGLPIKAEGRSKTGELGETNYYTFNQQGFITKVVVELKDVNQKIEIARERGTDGSVLVYNFKKYKLNEKNEYELDAETSTKYYYLEFDKYGNWTKRRGVYDYGDFFYTYRTYVYN